MSVCLICLEEGAPEAPSDPYHATCAKRLFGLDHAPKVVFDRATIPDTVARTVGKFSISGVQPKAQVRLSTDGSTLDLVEQGGRYLLKPDVGAYPCLPANEHLTMVLAERCGIHVPPNGLVRLADGSLAYLIRRFDRTGEAPTDKLAQEDFCSLAARRSGDKYDGSAELCMKLLRRYAKDPENASRQLFLQFSFSYWVGNGDLHLKNLSLLEVPGARLFTLSPAYDLVSTWIYGDNEAALPVRGKKRKITRRNWLEFAELHGGIAQIEAQGLLDEMLNSRPIALALVDRSAIHGMDLRERYRTILGLQADALVAVESNETPHIRI